MKTMVKKLPPWRAWLLATRPKTLTAAIIPVLAGTALATPNIKWEYAIYALIASFFIQIGTNLVNDSLDFIKGADTSKRIGPTRVTQMGYLSEREVLLAGITCFMIAAVFSIPLVFIGGGAIFAIILFSILCGYGYTGGPFPLAYLGLGDLFVLLFFGIISTSACFYFQSLHVSFSSIIAGLQIGFLATVMIAINNLRDIYQDRDVNKNTLAVRFGKKFAKFEIVLCALTPFVLNVYWLFTDYSYAAVLPYFTIPIAMLLVRSILIHDPSPIYNKFLGIGAFLHLSFGLLLAIGFLMS